jgi:hypothetical protein
MLSLERVKGSPEQTAKLLELFDRLKDWLTTKQANGWEWKPSPLYEKSLERQRVKDANQKFNGKPKQPGGSKRKIGGEKLYSDEIMELLTRAAKLFTQLQGKETVYWDHIIDLFDPILLKEHEKGLLKDL